MSLLLLAFCASVAVAGLAIWLRRPAEDRTGENLDLGEGSNLSAEPGHDAKPADPGSASSPDDDGQP